MSASHEKVRTAVTLTMPMGLAMLGDREEVPEIGQNAPAAHSCP